MFTLDKHQKDYNFLIIKPNGQTALSFRLQKRIVMSILGALFTIIMIGSGAIYFYTHAIAELSNHNKLQKKSSQQQIILDTYSEELHSLQQTLEELLENEAYIEDIIENNKGHKKRLKKKKTGKTKSIHSKKI